MTVPDLSVTATTSTTAASSAAPKDGSKLDKDAFLKLLVAQLKYQNPLAPTDPSAMMAQTAQFTMVESLQAISASQADAGAWQRVVAGQGLIGKQITGIGQDGATVTGLVTGMSITADGPVLKLADGTTLPVGAVLTVTAPDPAAAPATAGAPPAPPTTGTPTTGTPPTDGTPPAGTPAP